MTRQIYQVQISLNGSKPKIWRRILVSSDVSLPDFHKVVQWAMGWQDYHLHQFIKDNKYYTLRMLDDDYWDDNIHVDYQNKKLSDLLKKEKDVILYEYDFGDSWMHEIVLEKILPIGELNEYPVCLEGKMSCPPEDCGGVWGYADMLSVLKQPKHQEYNNILEWLGEDFDPEDFYVDEVNERLKGYKVKD
jgi:hypothetical protein